MTREEFSSAVIDFSRGDGWQRRETPEGLPSLGKYRPSGRSDTIVIDAGSWQYRAGFASRELPALVFDPTVHRYQVKSGDVPLHQVGATPPTGVARVTSRTPYEDGNVILHQASLEQIFDYTFGKLAVDAGGGGELNNPIFMTEVVANPPYCRRECSELLFEAYEAPKVVYGIDSLLSWHGNGKSGTSAMLISMGNYSTVVTIILDGVVRPEHIKRIDFGGRVATDYFLQLMQCKYPSFPVKMTLSQAEHVVMRVGEVSLNYDETMEAIARDPAPFDVVVQYPYVSESREEQRQREAQREALTEKRREMAQRLRERAETQREERLNTKRQQIESMKRLLKQAESYNEEDAELGDGIDRVAITSSKDLRRFGYEGIEDLQLALMTEQRELDRMMGIAEPKEAPDYSLVDIPDDQLGGDQIKEKRRQRLLKNAADARERIKREKEATEAKRKEQQRVLERRRQDDFEGWRSDLYEERRQLMGQLNAKQRKKEALADRRSQATIARLRAVVSLVHGDEDEGASGASGGGSEKKPSAGGKRKKLSSSSTKTNINPNPAEEGFGDDDADWLIYRQISRNDDEAALGDGGEDEEEAMQRRLTEIEGELEEYDTDSFYEQVTSEMEQSITILDRLRNGASKRRSNATEEADSNAAANQLHVNVERFRSFEGVFQPYSILGLEQAGLIETIEDLLKLVPLDTRMTLAENVLVTGGASQVKGLEARLARELRMIFPTDATLKIQFASKPHLDAWSGAASLVRDHGTNIPWISKQWYEENGGERLPSTSWFTNHF